MSMKTKKCFCKNKIHFGRSLKCYKIVYGDEKSARMMQNLLSLLTFKMQKMSSLFTFALFFLPFSALENSNNKYPVLRFRGLKGQ